MNHPRRIPAVVLLLLAACAGGPDEAKARGEAITVKVTVAVVAVDVAARTITLNGPSGEGTFQVGPEVKRLAEIKAGDKISAEYKVAAVSELRVPTEEEKKAPLVLSRGADRAPSDQPPGAAAARALRMVATIQSVDAAAKTFEVRGPLAGVVRVRVDDAAAFSSLKAGQAIVVTFLETLLLSVEPGPK